MSSSFKNTSREKRDFAYRSITNVPAPGRYKPKPVESQSFVNHIDIEKNTGRTELNKTFNINNLPNEQIERPWFSKNIVRLMTEPRKNLHGEEDDEIKKDAKKNKEKIEKDTIDFKYLEEKYKYIDSIDNAKKKPLALKQKMSKEVDDRDPPRLKTYNVSSYGYHYWDPAKQPKPTEIYWPPIPKKTIKTNNISVDFDKQSKRVNIEDMTFNVNASRFEYIDKNQRVLSTYESPRLFTIPNGNRVCRLSTNHEDKIINDKNYNTDQYFSPKKLRIGYVEMKKQSPRTYKNIYGINSSDNRTYDEDHSISKREKTKFYVDMSKSTKRDDKIYKTSQWAKSCQEEEIRFQRLKTWERDHEFKGRKKNEVYMKLKNMQKLIYKFQ